MSQFLLNRSLHAALFGGLLSMISLPVLAQDEAQLEMGKQVFAEAAPSCATCHRLADAEAAGTIGPDLDELKPTEEQVNIAVTTGVGVMPAYGGKLSEEEIAAVSAYVATAAGGQSAQE